MGDALNLPAVLVCQLDVRLQGADRLVELFRLARHPHGSVALEHLGAIILVVILHGLAAVTVVDDALLFQLLEVVVPADAARRGGGVRTDRAAVQPHVRDGVPVS